MSTTLCSWSSTFADDRGEGVAAAAGETRLVCSTNDPWCPPETSRRIGEATGIPIDWLEQAGHINTDAGYGPWPAVEAWALGESESPVAD